MRVLSLTFLALLLTLSYGVSAEAQMSVANSFTANLSLGSSGAQVLALQQLLNKDFSTQIASTGAGSLGNETGYFGLLTRAAVIRFQNKYASEILAPAGLALGNGYVGLYTRAKLNALSTSATVTGSVYLQTPPPAAPAPPVIPPPTTTVPQNPNLKNVDTFLADIDAVGAKQGLSSAALATIKQKVIEQVATTTDLRAAFFKQIKTVPQQSAESDSVLQKMLARVGEVFERIFMPEPVYAAGSGTPFGGALIFSFYCNQSDTWLIALTPLPPAYPVLLTYVPFTEAFLSYNIPETGNLLGFETPGAGVCIVGACPECITIPAEGMINPFVGSSPG